MGLDRHRLTPCGFCFVLFYTREDTVLSVKYLNGTVIDGRIIRVDIDWGFEEGRQYGAFPIPPQTQMPNYICCQILFAAKFGRNDDPEGKYLPEGVQGGVCLGDKCVMSIVLTTTRTEVDGARLWRRKSTNHCR